MARGSPEDQMCPVHIRVKKHNSLSHGNVSQLTARIEVLGVCGSSIPEEGVVRDKRGILLQVSHCFGLSAMQVIYTAQFLIKLYLGLMSKNN